MDRGLTIGREGEIQRITSTGYVFSSIENLEFIDTIEGAVVNSNMWLQQTSGMTITVANGAYNLNPTLVTTANAYANLITVPSFAYSNMTPLYVRWSQFASRLDLDANYFIEAGFGLINTNSTPTDGVYLRFNNSKAWIVQNNAGVETLQEIDLPVAGMHDEWFFYLYGTKVKFYRRNAAIQLNNVSVFEFAALRTQPAITDSNRANFFIRCRNGAGVTATPATVKLGQVAISNLNSAVNKTYNNKLVGFGRGCWQSPVTPFAKTANWTNSSAPGAGTLSNTVPAYNTLGGDFQFAAVAGAETDYALFSYQIPTGFQLYISEINISLYNFGAIGSAVTPTILEWAVALNQSAASLATVDNFPAGTWGPKIEKLGTQSLPLSAPIGAVATDIVRFFPDTNLCCEGSRYLTIMVKIPVGVNTASEFIRGNVGIVGVFE